MEVTARQISITGLGIHCAIAQSINEFTEALRQAKHNFCIKPGFFPQNEPLIAALLPPLDLKTSIINNFSHLPKKLTQHAIKCAQRATLPTQTATLAALQAYEQAKLHQRQLNSDKIGIIISGHNLNANHHFETTKEYLTSPTHILPSYAMQFMGSDNIGVLSHIFDIHGESFTIGNASASGNAAIIQAYRLIKAGILDQCLVIGSLADLSPLELQAFKNIGALGGKTIHTPEKACRPFDSKAEGFIYGQGCACLIIEKNHNDSSPPLAYIKGAATYLDANRYSEPSVNGEMTVIKNALKNANLETTQIDYINTHGTSSPGGDQAEAKAIKSVFADHLKNLYVNATKSLTGHCLWAAGVVECVATIVQMQQQFIHPTLNLVDPIAKDIQFVQNESIQHNVHTALNLSFGFGGINTCVVLNK